MSATVAGLPPLDSGSRGEHDALDPPSLTLGEHTILARGRSSVPLRVAFGDIDLDRSLVPRLGDLDFRCGLGLLPPSM